MGLKNKDRDSLVGAPPDTNTFSILKRNMNSSLAPDRAPISFSWPRNTNPVLTAPLPVFSILGNYSPGLTRSQLEIRKDREISTWVSHVQKYLQLVN